VDPAQPLAREEGIEEEPGAPLTYLQHEMDGEPADARLLAFLQYGPEMIDFSAAAPRCSFFPAANAGFSRFAGRCAGRAVGHGSALDGRLLGDWLHRLRPPLETISLAGWASPAARIWRTFSTPPAHRARRCMPPAACCVTAGSGCAPVAGSIWLTATRWSPACCVGAGCGVNFQLNAPVERLLADNGVAGAILRSDGGELKVRAGAVILACGGFPHDRQRLAENVPHAASGYGHFSAAPGQSGGWHSARRSGRRPV
jgi:hypothetical protein